MAPKPKLTKKKLPGPRQTKGLRMVSVRLDPDEHDVLRRVALNNALAEGSARPDVSKLIRVAVGEWIAKNKHR